MESLRKQAARILGEQRKYKIWLTAFLSLALLVTAGTVAALTLSGQALTADEGERALSCQPEIHRHTEQCQGSDGELICGQADYVIHTHDQSCYGEEGELVCTLPEITAELHVHEDACFTEQETLVCGQEESQGHEHGEACYEKVKGDLICEAEGTEHEHGEECYEKVKGDLTCGKDEAGHQHSPECYTRVKGDLTCGKDEAGHRHSPECYVKVKGDLTCTAGEGHGHGPECYTKTKGDLTCASQEEGHEHTDECYAWTEELTCGLAEESHEHTDECYAWNEELSCGQAEEEGHEHTDECYAWSEESVCEIPEGIHEHTDECYAWTEELTCETAEAEGAHTHTEECYATETALTCGQLAAAEHVHTEECFQIAEEPEPEWFQGALTAEGNGYTVEVTCGEDAELPLGTALNVQEIPEGSEEYEKYCQGVLAAIDSNTEITEEEAQSKEQMELTFAKFFRISFVTEEGEAVVPKTPVEAKIRYQSPIAMGEDGTASAACIAEDGTVALAGTVEETEESTGFGFVQNGVSVLATVAAQEQFPEGGRTLTAQGEDYTVMVTYGAEARIPKRATLKVEEILKGTAEFEACYQEMLQAIAQENMDPETPEKEIQISFVRFFDITFLVDNEKIEPEAPVDIRISYQNPVTVNEGEITSAVHFAEDGTEVLDAQVVESGEGSDFEFTQDSFSTTGAAVYSMNSAATVAEETEGSILDKMTLPEGKNGWQIVSGGYVGNTAGDKPAKNDKVRLQKNVIPTDVENEFLVYLSVDMKEEFTSYFEMSEFAAISSNNNHDTTIGTIIALNGSDVGVAYGSSLNKKCTITLKDRNGNVLASNVPFSFEKGNNITLYIKLSQGDNAGKYMLIGPEVREGSNTIQLPDTVIDILQKEMVTKFDLKSVVDDMGDYIIYDSVVKGDYDQAPSYDAGSGRLTWVPKVKGNPDYVETVEGNTKIVWRCNVAELIYRVRLDVTKAGFNSCAGCMNSGADDEHNGANTGHSYRVNESATLTYDKGTTLAFPVPYVRGLLYDISLKKADQDDMSTPLQGIQGAEFILRQNGQTVTDRDGNPLKGISDENGLTGFENLPWGTYTLVETKAPAGYKAVPEGGKEVGTVTVCYTNAPSDVAQDAKIPANMIYTGASAPEGTMEDGNIIVRNEKIVPIKLVKVWDDENDAKGFRPEEVQFKVEYRNGAEDAWKPIDNGTDGIVTLRAPEGSSDAAAQWTELVTELPEAIEYRVSEVNLDDRYEAAAQQADTDIVYAVKTTETLTIDGQAKEINVYTITNCLKTRTVRLLKTAAANQGDQDTFLEGAVFKLYNKTADTFEGETNPESIWTTAENPDGTKVSGENGLVFDEPLELGSYWLQEVSAPEGYVTPEAPYELEVGVETITLRQGTDIIAQASVGTEETSIEVKVANVPAEKSVMLRKKETGAGNRYLNGAEFKVTYTADDGQTTEYTWKSAEVEGTAGVLCDTTTDEPVRSLGLGTWHILETKAPAGYILPAKAFVITVTTGGIDKKENMEEVTITKDEQEETYTIEIANSTGAMLPETGGPGITMYTLGGLAAIAVSLVYGLGMRRKKEKGGRP